MKQVFSTESNTTPLPLPASVSAEETARRPHPLPASRTEFLLSDTTLIIDEKRTLIRDSAGMGWSEYGGSTYP